MIEIKTYFFDYNLNSETLEKVESFSTWSEAKIFLQERIKIKRDFEIFKIEIGGKNFGEFNKSTFNSLHQIEEEFKNILEQNKKDAEIKSGGKKSRIEIRIDAEEKKKILKKAEKSGLNISEYTRQLYNHGEVIIVSDQTKRDVRGMAINLNQIAKRINSGAISSENVISELKKLLEELNKTYKR